MTQTFDWHPGADLRAPPCRDRDEAPKQTTAEDEVLATKTVADDARQRRTRGINPHESRADEAKLHLVETELFLELGEHGGNGLAVSVIEEANEPEHHYHPPFVRVAAACRFHRMWSSLTCSAELYSAVSVEIFARREDVPERGSVTRSSVAGRQTLEYTRRALRWQRAAAHRAALLWFAAPPRCAVSQSCTLPGDGKLRTLGSIRRSAEFNSAIQLRDIR